MKRQRVFTGRWCTAETWADFCNDLKQRPHLHLRLKNRKVLAAPLDGEEPACHFGFVNVENGIVFVNAIKLSEECVLAMAAAVREIQHQRKEGTLNVNVRRDENRPLDNQPPTD